MEDRTFWLSNFYQPLPDSIEHVVNGNVPLNENQIERMGAPIKGLYAMECLLFSTKSSETNKTALYGNSHSLPPGTWLLKGDSSLRCRTYLSLMANNLNNHLKIAAMAAQAKDLPATFEAGGRDSVSLLVNQLTVTLEAGIIIPLNEHTNKPSLMRVKSYKIGRASGTIVSGMKVLLVALHNFYDGETGFGLKDYVCRVNPGLNDRLEAQFKATAAALSVLKEPPNALVGVQQEEWAEALTEARKLEILCKVDLTSALGVTIMFSAYDGD